MTEIELLCEIKAKLEGLEKMISNPLRGKYMTPKQVSDALGISKQTLWAWNKDGTLTHSRIGGKVLYDKDDVDMAIKKLKQKEKSR